jgi:hypothetical protein
MCGQRWDFSFPLQNRAKLFSTGSPFWVRRNFLPHLFLISLFSGRRPSIPPLVPVEVDARVDNLQLSAPTSPPLARAPTLVAECSRRKEAGGVTRTLAGDYFGGRESGALRARWRGTISEGESRGHCAHRGSRVFRREGELGALRAFRQQSVSEGET